MYGIPYTLQHRHDRNTLRITPPSITDALDSNQYVSLLHHNCNWSRFELVFLLSQQACYRYTISTNRLLSVHLLIGILIHLLLSLRMSILMIGVSRFLRNTWDLNPSKIVTGFYANHYTTHSIFIFYNFFPIFL